MMDINEVLESLRGTVQYPALILENLSGSYQASNLDNPLKVINGGFLIIGHLNNPDDFQGEMHLIGRMKAIGHQVIARMLHDHLKCEVIAEKAIQGFDINSVTYEVIGPVFDNDFGVLYSLNIQDILDIEYDPSKW